MMYCIFFQDNPAPRNPCQNNRVTSRMNRRIRITTTKASSAFPFTAVARLDTNCSAVAVTDRHVLTAARCVASRGRSVKSSCSLYFFSAFACLAYRIQYNTYDNTICTIQYNTIQKNNTIQYNAIQYNITQYNTTQHNTDTTQHNTIQLYDAMQCNTYNNAQQYNRMQCNATQRNAGSALQCIAVHCIAVQCSAVQYSTVQCNTNAL